jgi:DNA repair exonuclease SbcCD ATPase subunit
MNQAITLEKRPPQLSTVDPSWLERRQICAQLGVSLKALRRLVRDGWVERRVERERTEYRLLSNDKLALQHEGPDTEELALALDADEALSSDGLALAKPPEAPSSVAREARPAPTAEQAKPAEGQPEWDVPRLVGLLKLAVEQRDQAQEARKEVLRRQEQILDRLDLLIEQRDEALRQRDDSLDLLRRLKDERDDLRAKLPEAISQRDKALQQRDQVLEQLRQASEDRDKITQQHGLLLEQLDRALAQREYVQKQLQQAHKLLLEWREWRDDAQQTLNRAEERNGEALRVAATALSTPWWAFQKRKALQSELDELLKPEKR